MLDEPFDEAAEQAVLGSILLNYKILQKIGTILEVDEFYKESHRAIFQAMLDLDNKNIPIDTVSLVSRLRQLDFFAVAGGASYLMDLGRRVPSSLNARFYVDIVKTKAAQRKLIQFGREIIRDAMGEVEDIAALIDLIAGKSLNLSISGLRNGVVPLWKALSETIDITKKLSTTAQEGNLAGVPSGFHELDAKTNGWQRGELIILAARPGMGKTAFALNILQNAGNKQNPFPSIFFSLEMTKTQLAARIWSSEARVNSHNLRSGNLSDLEWDKLWAGIEKIKHMPIFIDDTPALSIAEMMRKCRQLKHEHDIQLVVVDYLQLMTASTSGKYSSREQQISEISRTLKVLAKELNVPVIALSQLNRGVESRTDKRPMLSDLRESGAIEQDADVIIFLYREDYYAQMKGENDENDENISLSSDSQSITEIIIAKNRSGPTGKIEVNFEKEYTLFSNIGSGIPPLTDMDIPESFEMEDSGEFLMIDDDNDDDDMPI